MTILHDLFPYKIERPLPFAFIDVGQVFKNEKEEYRLLSRDAHSVTILRWFKLYDLVFKILGRKIERSGESI